VGDEDVRPGPDQRDGRPRHVRRQQHHWVHVVAHLRPDVRRGPQRNGGPVGEAGNAALALLPTSATVGANVPAGRTFVGTTLAITRANQQALGLRASDSTSDGTITFNSTFNFDYDRSNGIGAGQTEFQTVAAHEIGHLLGFFSDADDFDNGATSTDLSTLDLFRFPNGAKPANVAQFGTFARDLRPNVEAVTSDGTGTEYRMSTGFNLGDGRQASHWKADELLFGTFNPIGIMDPTLSANVFEPVVASDLRAMELIGYETIPEPASAAVLTVAAAGVLAGRRRRRLA
jgi:hypothetical protein